jgi:hypothetical protein
MKKTTALLVAIASFTVCLAVYAVYDVLVRGLFQRTASPASSAVTARKAEPVPVNGRVLCHDGTRAAPKGEQVLELVLARAAAVSSGRFELVRSTGFRENPNSRTPRGPYRFSLSGNDWARRALHRFSLSGDDWAQRMLYEKNVIVNRDKQRMSLYSCLQDDGTYHYGAQFRPPVSIRKVEGDTSPFFAGTFWLQETLDFVSSWRDRMTQAGVETIDHIETVVLEWPIAASDVFKVLPEANGVTGTGGTLRVYAAPSLGYALPRIEIVGTHGRVGCRFESSGFQQVAPGLWFPMKSTWQWYDPKPAFYEEYEFSNVALVNEQIPKEDFEYSVPPKTLVADMRDPASSATITVESEKDQAALEALLRDAPRQGTRP